MEAKVCTRCKQQKNTEDFYRYKTKIRHWCKECDVANTIIRQAIFKELCVEYKGGKCEKCGYDKYIGALEFHHRDPSQKKFSIGNAKLRKFDNKIIEELDKCELLCSNCHREAHNVYDINKLRKIWVGYDEQKQRAAKLIGQEKNVCNCGNKKSRKAKKCLKCENKKAIERNIDEVINKIKESNWTQAGKFFGVSDNALRKFLKKNGVDPKNINQP